MNYRYIILAIAIFMAVVYFGFIYLGENQSTGSSELSDVSGTVSRGGNLPAGELVELCALSGERGDKTLTPNLFVDVSEEYPFINSLSRAGADMTEATKRSGGSAGDMRVPYALGILTNLSLGSATASLIPAMYACSVLLPEQGEDCNMANIMAGGVRTEVELLPGNRYIKTYYSAESTDTINLIVEGMFGDTGQISVNNFGDEPSQMEWTRDRFGNETFTSVGREFEYTITESKDCSGSATFSGNSAEDGVVNVSMSWTYSNGVTSGSYEAVGADPLLNYSISW
jgi:hypothetical protein